MARLHFLKSVTDTINTSIIFETEHSVIVFDGGHRTEAEYLREYLLGLGGHVDAWFLTHAHDDHVNAIFEILNNHDDITVDRACYNFSSDEWLESIAPGGEGITMARCVRKALNDKSIPIDTVQAGDTYTFDGLTVRVLRVPDERVDGRSVNNASTVFRVEVDGKSILILGDLDVEGGRQLLELVDPALLKADYCQMAHHGQNGVEREVYEVIRPSYCLWATPSWLWDNTGDGGYDTGPFQTLVTRGWISAMHCVKRHYLMTDGTQIIDLAAQS